MGPSLDRVPDAIRRAAVLGKPIAHSLSPVLHTAGYAAAGLAGWTYTAVECAESELAGFVAGLGPQWAGLSLTMPLKEVALQVAGTVSPLALALGAANTLVPGPTGWYADNTDAPGMVDALRAAGTPDGVAVAILGGGGTARAALAAARELRARSVTVYVRRPVAGDELRPVAAALGVPLAVAPWSLAAGACHDDDLVVSTVPKGGADHLAGADWRPGGVLFDVVYDPWPTPVAAAATRAGCRVVSGLDLLLTQGARQFELYTGVPAPVAEMRAALEAAAAGR
jgi:shikimate dehydrogenase